MIYYFPGGGVSAAAHDCGGFRIWRVGFCERLVPSQGRTLTPDLARELFDDVAGMVPTPDVVLCD